jgi:hypothetical protein
MVVKEELLGTSSLSGHLQLLPILASLAFIVVGLVTSSAMEVPRLPRTPITPRPEILIPYGKTVSSKMRF